MAESREGGFTFIEVLFTMVFFGMMVAIGAAPYANYRHRQEHLASTRELVAFLRRAQVRAVAEEVTYRVDFAASGNQVTSYRFNGSSFDQASTLRVTDSRIAYVNPKFAQPTGGTGSSVYFYERGAAGKGSVTLTLSGKSKTYTVDVEGLTARVSYK